MTLKSKFTLGLLATSALCINFAYADEGMWTFDQFPAQKVKKTYNFNPDPKWLNHIQNSAVRLSSGCSASFVSKDGLILTNWHCSEGCVNDISTAQNDYAKNGFLALKREDEKTCPNMSAEVLEKIIDVTNDVKAATKDKTGTELATARNTAFNAAIDKSCKGLSDEKYRCDMVTLYRGGQYKIYKYRTYNDVRLVFEPEYAVGFFGGDPDNFNFPRYNLDASFLRAYENGKPVTNVEHLTWTTDVPKENDLVFVAGNPGSTQRLRTLSQLKFNRDYLLPTRQLVRSELRGRLTQYMHQGEEQNRQGSATLFGLENSYKAQYGQMRALMDPDFFAIKTKEENDLRAKVNASPDLKAQIGNPWAQITKAGKKQQDLFLEYEFLESRAGSISSLYSVAKTIVRAAYEKEKPASNRLPGYSDNGLKAIERQLLTQSPIYKDQEIMGLELWASKTREFLTVDNDAVKNILGKESPEDLARRLINNTKLDDLKVREALLKGGKAAVLASDDPLIQFMVRIDPQARAIREKYIAEVDSPMSVAAEKIANARFGAYGAEVYPDATFTLRLSYGKVQGWEYNGVKVPSYTKMGGAYERATGSFPFELAKSWVEAENKIDKNIVFDISTTNDIIGGNSGSPLIDQKGRVVGAVFDGNIHSLGGDYAYDARVNRAVSVTTAAVEEALKKIYNADHLIKELNGK
jgi:Peptidase S46